MMKYFSLLFIYIFLVCSCSSNDAQTQQESNVDTIAVNDAKAARILQQKPDAKWNQPQAEFSSGTEKKLEVKRTSTNSTELYKEMDFFKGERVIKRDDYISENEEFKHLNN